MKYTKPFYIVINPTGSLFAKTLQTALRLKCVNRVFRRNTPRVGRDGRSRPFFRITQPALNKIEQLNRFTAASVSCPGFCTESSAIQNLGVKAVFARTLINSTNGRGIVEHVVGDGPIPRAPLYTAYIPKKAEYRVHVFNGEVIDVQQKKQKSEFAGARNTRIRNLASGYVYCRDGIAPPDGCTDLAVRAVAACGYLYGAVDIIYNEKRNACYVLEVNSRPGLCQTTLDKYADALVKHFNLKERT